jgi:hypothetical protein
MQTTAAPLTPLSSAAPKEVTETQEHGSPQLRTKPRVHKPQPTHTASIERQEKTNEQPLSPKPQPSKIDAAPVDSARGVESTKNSLDVQPRVALRVEQRTEANDSSLQIQPPAPQEPPPVINVTIGRIEVRATSASSATTTPHSRPSAKLVMSLDEYLRRRTKGGGE